MKKFVGFIIVVAVVAVALYLVQGTDGTDGMSGEQATLMGVDLENKILTIGALNDESGPAAAIGKPYAVGKRILAEHVNAGGSGLLPEGWSIRLVERDHGYNPQKALQLYNEIKDQILFIGTSFGTPNTLPLRPHLKRDGIVAFPASLSSKMAEFEYTPPLGTPYSLEAMRAMDWAVEEAGGAENVKAAVVYQQDDYGMDGLEGWQQAATYHGVEVVSEQPVQPGQSDYTAVVSALKEAGANYILLTTLPSGTGPILGTAAQLQYMPTWIGNTPSWIDKFFNPEVLPPVVLTNFHWIAGLPYWGEELPGMQAFLSAYETYGAEMSDPDFYILASYIQGLIELEAFNRAVESGDMTRAGYLAALQSISGFDAGGLIQPVDLTKFPYVTGTEARVLKPVPDEGTWEVAAPYAEPQAYGTEPAPSAATDEEAAMADEGDEMADEGGAESAQ